MTLLPPGMACDSQVPLPLDVSMRLVGVEVLVPWFHHA
jgi:hypothetical protein